MELVPGLTLAEKLTHGPLAEDEVVRLGLQIAGALQAVHEAGVLHRDLNPVNVMVTPKGEANVMDFVLAQRFGSTSELSATVTVTAPQGLTGAPQGIEVGSAGLASHGRRAMQRSHEIRVPVGHAPVLGPPHHRLQRMVVERPPHQDVFGD